MRSKLISIQAMLIPQLEVMQREMQLSQDLINEDHNISMAERLIDLDARL